MNVLSIPGKLNPTRAELKEFIRDNPQATLDYMKAPTTRGGGQSKALVGELACEVLVELQQGGDEAASTGG